MKKEDTICPLLGIRQEDMAMLLGITRAQWSMYESGKRDLPTNASILFSEMLAHVLAPETENKSIFPTELKPSQQQPEIRLRENQYQYNKRDGADFQSVPCPLLVSKISQPTI